MLLQTIGSVYHIADDAINFFTDTAFNDPNLGVYQANEIVKTSNGAFSPVINLDDLNWHNRLEHDASLTRLDSYFGNNHVLDLALFNQMLSYSSDGVGLSLQDLLNWRDSRLKDSRDKNPQVQYPISRVAQGYGEILFIINIFGDGQKISIDHAKSFFQNESLPGNWTKRKAPYSLAELDAQVAGLIFKDAIAANKIDLFPDPHLKFVFSSAYWGLEALQYIWCLLVMLAGFKFFYALTAICFPHVEKKDTFALYFVNIISSSVALVVFFYALFIPVFIKGESAWLHIQDVVGATSIIICLYFVELLARHDMPFFLAFHHVLTILLGFWGFVMRNEAQMKQLLLYMSFATLEQPSFIGMICYRIGTRRVKIWGLYFAAASFAVTRLINLAAAIFFMAHDWSFYYLDFKIAFLFFLALITWSQYETISVYFKLIKKVQYEPKESNYIAKSAMDSDSEVSFPTNRNIDKSISLDEKAPRKTKKKSVPAWFYSAILVVPVLIGILIAIWLPAGPSLTPFEKLDGTNNHIVYTKSGSSNRPFPEMSNSQNSANLPNPKQICDTLFTRDLENPEYDGNNVTLWDVSFGQFISHDVLLTGTDLAGPPIFQGSNDFETAWPWVNSNEQTPWLDLSHVYGTTGDILSKIRDPNDRCKLSLDANGHIPRDSHGILLVADTRTAQSPYLMGWTTIFIKEHNFQCATVSVLYPDAPSDEIFLRARELTILVYQKQIMNYVQNYGPGAVKFFVTDEPNSMSYFVNLKDVAITRDFSLSYRLHTMIPDKIKIVAENGTVVDTYSIDQVFFNTSLTDTFGLDAMLRGAMLTPANAYNSGYPTALRTSRFDLCQIDVRRAREKGLPAMNDLRASLGLDRLTHWYEISSNTTLQDALKSFYSTIDNVEGFVGALVEEPKYGNSLSELSVASLLLMAEDIARGDRWSILNIDVAPRDTFWKSAIVNAAYGRNIHALVNQHTSMKCLPVDPMRYSNAPPC
ncbi:UNVERIFIED_CONTAM: hypothetical protein HDU68_010134 [Siphonaria sp. JEL0065]|nr:hypothetical protein HDU68_010134 [Siphonaria sp. JEL0065]